MLTGEQAVGDDSCLSLLNFVLAQFPLSVKQHVPDEVPLSLSLGAEEVSIPAVITNVRDGLFGVEPIFAKHERNSLIVEREGIASAIEMQTDILGIRTRVGIQVATLRILIPFEFSCSTLKLSLIPERAEVFVEVRLRRTANPSVANMIDTKFRTLVGIKLSELLTKAVRDVASSLIPSDAGDVY